MKTYVATPLDRERNWLLVDAEGQTLGRLATQIADALRTVATQPEVLPAMAAAGIEQARQFSWDRVARETLEVFWTALGGRR